MRSFVVTTQKITTAAVASSLLGTLFAGQAQAQTSSWKGICVSDSGVATIQGIQCLLGNVLSVALTGIGFAAFVMVIVAGFRYLISGGNSKGTETARSTLTYAVIGIAVALSGFIILNLLSDFTGIDSLLQFSIPTSSDGL